jgi:hypothetical protein
MEHFNQSAWDTCLGTYLRRRDIICFERINVSPLRHRHIRYLVYSANGTRILYATHEEARWRFSEVVPMAETGSRELRAVRKNMSGWPADKRRGRDSLTSRRFIRSLMCLLALGRLSCSRSQNLCYQSSRVRLLVVRGEVSERCKRDLMSMSFRSSRDGDRCECCKYGR